LNIRRIFKKMRETPSFTKMLILTACLIATATSQYQGRLKSSCSFYVDPRERIACWARFSQASCRDDTKCTNYDTCSDHDAALRSGMICPDMVFSYRGAYGIRGPLQWDREEEEYTCTLVVNESYCHSWNKRADSHGEIEYGTCNCTLAEKNICMKWKCEDDEYEKCGDGCSSWPNAQRPERCTCKVCEENRGCRRETRATYIKKEYTEGWCTKTRGRECVSWNQREWTQDYPDVYEFEMYMRTEDGYFGNVTTPNLDKEFEISKCQPLSQNENGVYLHWKCEERGMMYFKDNQIIFFSAFGFIFIWLFAWNLVWMFEENDCEIFEWISDKDCRLKVSVHITLFLLAYALNCVTNAAFGGSFAVLMISILFYLPIVCIVLTCCVDITGVIKSVCNTLSNGFWECWYKLYYVCPVEKPKSPESSDPEDIPDEVKNMYLEETEI